MPDVWATGAAYEPFIGRWSRRVAREFVATLGVPANAAWLDVGCGTGALTETILEDASPARVEGVDASTGFVTYARARIPDPRASFTVADATKLPQPDDSVDAVVSGLVLNFVPAPERAVAEMARVAKSGRGTVGVYVWDYAEGMQLLRTFWDVAARLDPAAAELDEARRFPLCRPAPLAALFGGSRFRDVSVRAIEVPTRFRDFDDYWQPFLGGQGPAPSYVTGLGEQRRDALRDALRAELAMKADGSLDLIARAWAVRASVT